MNHKFNIGDLIKPKKEYNSDQSFLAMITKIRYFEKHYYYSILILHSKEFSSSIGKLNFPSVEHLEQNYELAK